MFSIRPIPFALAALFTSSSALADDLVLQRVLVEGSRMSQLGIADSANAGTVGQKELAARTTYRPGEMLEAMPGLIASQHSGEGKANQFYLRGFNLDHGTDLATWVDGMPVNQRSHAHGQGWTDVNFLIPELVGRLDYRKGPYSARDSDFASAGSAEISYANRLVKDIASVTLGQDGFRRAMIAGSPELAGGTLLYALELLDNEGPWTRPDDYRKRNGILRYSRGYANNGWSVTAMAYRGTWNATDQIPLRAVEDGSLGRFDAIDDSDGGSARRYSLSGIWRRTDADSASKVSAYVIRNQLDLFSNFTYFMNDPVNGDQFAQPDRRVTSGVDATHTLHLHRGEAGASDLTFGARLQNDNIFNGLYNTRARERLSTTREDHVVETSGGLFIESATRWNEVVRTKAGLRADRYRFDVSSDLAANSGRAHDTQVSPSFSLILAPLASTEFYLNYGHGFHSNDARGTVAAIDPATLDPLERAPGLVRSRGMELGMRTEAIPKMQTAVSLYRLDFDSELTYIGDAGMTEAGDASRRYGVEFSNYWRPLKWLAVDFDAAYARARSRNGDRIPGAVEGVGQLALTVDKVGPWSGALRLRYFGPRPLIEDNSVRSHASTTLNGRVGYKINKDLQLELEAFNLTDRRASAIDYFYASQLPGEAEPRDDIHFHPIEPRSLRLTLTKTW
ncbi:MULTISPECIES: TonB-dependent receptor [unclassified Massilia]|uniref:TonB-dependent receptor n=1 Tax=unclassified Massilia TaxID=2609279 RepID=UPI00177E8AD0|nr:MULTISPECIES: TonB-dependent receptor [unclassified Massilia]MBD8529838.1 TonB-dependent receptor [Massilia sp. CFBP 13647]MBD8672150.1 TonB-dependent receptor [Massilia sp. CFBP 13721]